jgi:membrane protein YqaA with SNARE-associated domain
MNDLVQNVTAALVSWGPLGIFLLAFIDSAGIPVSAGMDALVILLAVNAPERAWLGAGLAVAGSLAGNILLFLLSRKGGRRLMEAVPHPGAKPSRFRAWFQRYGLVTVFIPAVLPIPLPLKVFVISAGALHTSFSSFFLVVLTARTIRYFGEAYLGFKMGQNSTQFLRENVWILILIGAGLCGLLFFLIKLGEWLRRSASDANRPLQ